MNRRNFMLIGLISLISVERSESLDIKPLKSNFSLTKALYINCLQRTQTQQLLKEYIMIALKSNYDNPKEKLPKDVKAYDERFYVLYNYFMHKLKDKQARKKMKKAKDLWESSKKILLKEPDNKNIMILDNNFKEMIHLLSAPKVLKTKKSFKAVAKTGHMCRIPLYMANLYLMKVLGIEIPDYIKRMQDYIKKFREDIKFLEAYSENTDDIKNYLKKASNSFIFFEMMYRSKRSAIPTLISKKADDIFYNIRTIKSLYGKM